MHESWASHDTSHGQINQPSAKSVSNMTNNSAQRTAAVNDPMPGDHKT